MLPILLIPGNMCDERLWQPVANRLSQKGYAVQHAKRLEQETIGSMAESLRGEVRRASAIIGFSMGAIVAAEFARRWPTVVKMLGLVAFNASADLPERVALRPQQQQAVRQGQLETIVADELKPNYLAEANRGNAELLDTVMQMARSIGPEVFIAQSEALRLRADLRPQLPHFSMPVLLASGSEDRLCPPDWHRTWQEMIGANADMVEIAGAGHLLPMEQPDALAGALLDWLAKESECQIAS